MSRDTLLKLGAILLLAFALRVAWVAAVPTTPTGGDPLAYHSFAETILDGHGFSYAVASPTHSTPVAHGTV